LTFDELAQYLVERHGRWTRVRLPRVHGGEPVTLAEGLLDVVSLDAGGWEGDVLQVELEGPHGRSFRLTRQTTAVELATDEALALTLLGTSLHFEFD
jgi:hypothetical protein